MSIAARLIIAVVVFWQLPTPALAGTAEKDLVRRLDTYLSRITPFGYSGAVLISIDGDVVLNNGYGDAIRTSRTPNTPETVFSTGSLTKQFTAAAILKLEMMGKLRTADVITAFIDDVPDDKAAITLHHLLTHTAGLPGSSGRDFDRSLRDETVRRILDVPLEFAPGTEMSYSNCGYTLLGAVIEIVSGQPYERFLSEHLFEPSGMKSTGYRLPEWDSLVVAHNYVGDADNARHLDRLYPYWNLIGNGGILSTTGDMYRWYLALRGDQILSPAAKTKLWTPFLNEYAYGWDVLETDDGDTLIRHDGGSTMGNSAVVDWLVEKDILIVIFCNQSYGQNPLFEVVEEKVRAIVGGESFNVPATLPAAQWNADHLRPLEGVYRLPGGGEVNAVLNNSALQLTATGQTAINALLFPGDAATDSFDDFNVRTRALIEGAKSGDKTPFETELGAGSRADQFREFVEQEIHRVEMNAGEEITDVVIVGTVPATVDGVVATGVHFRTGAAIAGGLSVLWRDGRLAGLDQLVFLPAVPFVPEPAGDGSFAGYHLVWAKDFHVKAKRSGEEIAGLEMGGGVFAARVE